MPEQIDFVEIENAFFLKNESTMLFSTKIVWETLQKPCKNRKIGFLNHPHGTGSHAAYQSMRNEKTSTTTPRPPL